MSALDKLRAKLLGKKNDKTPESVVVHEGVPLKVQRVMSNGNFEGCKITNPRGESFTVKFVNDVRFDGYTNSYDDKSMMVIMDGGKEIDSVGARSHPECGYAKCVLVKPEDIRKSPFGWAYEIANQEMQKYVEEEKDIRDKRTAAGDRLKKENESAAAARRKAYLDKFLRQ